MGRRTTSLLLTIAILQCSVDAQVQINAPRSGSTTVTAPVNESPPPENQPSQTTNTISPAGVPLPSGTGSSSVTSLILQDATPVKLRLSRTLSSADAQVDDKVDFEVLDEVKVGDLIVIAKGGIAWGTVTVAEPKRRLGRAGKLDLVLDAVQLTDGSRAALRAVKSAKGDGKTGAMTAGIVVTGLLVWPAAPFFLFMKGKDITIPKGAEITAYVNGDTRLKMEKKSSVTVIPEQSSVVMLEITSNPTGADIDLNGAFVGNTPSTIGVVSGDQTITVTKSGFQKWERKIRTTSGHVKITVELERIQTSNTP